MKILITNNAQKDFNRLPVKLRSGIQKSVDRLATTPFPPNSLKLNNRPGFRLRVGTYRVLYLFDNDSKVITVTHILHRKEAYRK